MSAVPHRALTVAGLLVLPVNLALAQPGGAVRGGVVDELGRPISEAIVAVNSFGATTTEEIQTTSDGQYAYSGVAAGLYTITATKDELGGEVFRIRVRDGGRHRALVEAGERKPCHERLQPESKPVARATTMAPSTPSAAPWT